MVLYYRRTASERLVFVGGVAAVVLAVADPAPADAAAVGARPLAGAVARPVRPRADARRLVARVAAVILAVAVPARRDAAVSRRAPEIICNAHTHTRAHGRTG